MEHRFTRKELYDKVWSKPISHLVSELGTTTAILGALLRRADIPTPPSGYWTRKEFGKPVAQMALPPAPPGCPEPLLLDTEARDVGRRAKPVEVMEAPKSDPVSEHNVPAASEVPAPVALKPRPTQPTTMTREELYGAVWTTPMARLAEQYGISGNGLAKICDRENIPYPPRGYWAKHAVGKAPTASPMAKSDDGSRSITIRPTPLPPPPVELPQEVKQQVERARANELTILVQERLLSRMRSSHRGSPSMKRRSGKRAGSEIHGLAICTTLVNSRRRTGGSTAFLTLCSRPSSVRAARSSRESGANCSRKSRVRRSNSRSAKSRSRSGGR